MVQVADEMYRALIALELLAKQLEQVVLPQLPILRGWEQLNWLPNTVRAQTTTGYQNMHMDVPAQICP